MEGRNPNTDKMVTPNHINSKEGLVTLLGATQASVVECIRSGHWDNRIENLQIICPNCHALETAKAKN